MKFVQITVLLIAVTVISLFAQVKNKDVFEKDLKIYMTAYNSKNWDKVASMIYPKLFTISPKESIIEQLVSLDTSGLSITFDFKNVNKTSEIITAGKERFCLLAYSCNMKIALSKKMLEAAPTLKSTFEAQYSNGRVEFDTTTNTFDIDANLYMYAVSQDKGKNWSYMEKNDSMSYIFDSLIPKKVLKKLEKFN